VPLLGGAPPPPPSPPRPVAACSRSPTRSLPPPAGSSAQPPRLTADLLPHRRRRPTATATTACPRTRRRTARQLRQRGRRRPPPPRRGARRHSACRLSPRCRSASAAGAMRLPPHQPEKVPSIVTRSVRDGGATRLEERRSQQGQGSWKSRSRHNRINTWGVLSSCRLPKLSESIIQVLICAFGEVVSRFSCGPACASAGLSVVVVGE